MLATDRISTDRSSTAKLSTVELTTDQVTRDKIAVQCRAVHKGFGAGDTHVRVLRGVDLEARTGELLMLVGPSGCGKTTLISIVAGILDADEGECRVFGTDMKTLSAAQKTAYRGRTIGFVFQAFNLVPALTIAENTSIPLLLRGMKRAEALERAVAMLSRVGLGERAKSLPAQLSGGQQQRVAIARALVTHPRLIVCDEPTSALDHENGQRVMELLRGMAAEEGTTLVVVTHDARIFAHADRIAKVNDGRIVEVVESVRQSDRETTPRPQAEAMFSDARDRCGRTSSCASGIVSHLSA